MASNSLTKQSLPSALEEAHQNLNLLPLSACLLLNTHNENYLDQANFDTVSLFKELRKIYNVRLCFFFSQRTKFGSFPWKDFFSLYSWNSEFAFFSSKRITFSSTTNGKPIKTWETKTPNMLPICRCFWGFWYLAEVGSTINNSTHFKDGCSQ